MSVYCSLLCTFLKVLSYGPWSGLWARSHCKANEQWHCWHTLPMWFCRTHGCEWCVHIVLLWFAKVRVIFVTENPCKHTAHSAVNLARAPCKVFQVSVQCDIVLFTHFYLDYLFVLCSYSLSLPHLASLSLLPMQATSSDCPDGAVSVHKQVMDEECLDFEDSTFQLVTSSLRLEWCCITWFKCSICISNCV